MAVGVDVTITWCRGAGGQGEGTAVALLEAGHPARR